MNDVNDALERWIVTATARRGEPGEGVVTFEVTNGRYGRFPPMQMMVDWKPGMEMVDVEVAALAIGGSALRALSEEFFKLGGAKMNAP